MDLHAYTRILRTRWRLVLVAVFVCLGAAAGVVYATTPTYRAYVQLFVSTQGGDTAADLQSGNTFTQARVASYAKIAASPIVLQPVLNQLGLTETVQSLGSEVTASAPENTVLIYLSVTTTNPTLAAKIANAVAAQFTIAVARLEQPTAGGAAPVRVTVTQPATAPQSPVSPNVRLTLALGLIIGLVLGVGAAVLRDTLDTTIRDDDDIKRLTDVPVIGAITIDPEASARPLVVQSNPHGPRAEAFRQLRTNLQFLNVSDRRRSIVITSSIPAEGKSTTTANLALTLAAAGSSVALVEADLRRPRIADYMGLDNGAGLTNVLIGQASVEDVLQPWGNGKLAVIASGPRPPNPSELLGSAAMETLIKELDAKFDYVLIDAPPILPFTDAAILSKSASETILLIGSGRTTRDELTRSLETLATVSANVVGIVANFLPARAGSSYDYGYGYAPNHLDARARKSTRKSEAPSPGSSVETPSGSRVDLEWDDLVNLSTSSLASDHPTTEC